MQLQSHSSTCASVLLVLVAAPPLVRSGPHFVVVVAAVEALVVSVGLLNSDVNQKADWSRRKLEGSTSRDTKG